MQKLLRNERRLTVRFLSHELGMAKTVIQKIVVDDFNMSKVLP